MKLTALNLSVAVEAEIRESLLAVDGVVGAGLAGDGLEEPVQTLDAKSLELWSVLVKSGRKRVWEQVGEKCSKLRRQISSLVVAAVLRVGERRLGGLVGRLRLVGHAVKGYGYSSSFLLNPKGT